MTEQDEYPWKLNRTIAIAAPVSLVYEMITTTAHWARWWGEGSRIVAEPGGDVLIRYPNGIEVVGEVVGVRAGAYLAFTYGYASGTPVPPGGSIVEIELEPDGEGTPLRLTHALRDEKSRDQHEPGWRFQLSVFTNIVLDHLHAEAGGRVDAWFAAWAEGRPDERRRQFEAAGSRLRRPAVHAGCAHDQARRRQALPGRGPGGLDCGGRRAATRGGHRPVLIRAGWQASPCHRILVAHMSRGTVPPVPPAESRRRPSRADLEAAVGRTIPDVVASDLDVLFCGINPGRYSGATGFHFAGPGNRFWQALYDGGFTDTVLQPSESKSLPAMGCGLTNLVARTTATAAEVTADELRAGRRRLVATVRRYRPRFVAIVGIGAYRQAFGQPRASPGPQDEHLEGAALWVLPNPSGLNANYQASDFARWFRALHRAAEAARRGDRGEDRVTGRKGAGGP